MNEDPCVFQCTQSFSCWHYHAYIFIKSIYGYTFCLAYKIKWSYSSNLIQVYNNSASVQQSKSDNGKLSRTSFQALVNYNHRYLFHYWVTNSIFKLTWQFYYLSRKIADENILKNNKILFCENCSLCNFTCTKNTLSDGFFYLLANWSGSKRSLLSL